MQYAYFDEVMRETFRGRAYLLLIVMAWILLSTVIRVFYFRKTRDNGGFSIMNFAKGVSQRRARLTTKQQMSRNIVLFILLGVLGIGWLYPAYRDVQGKQYLQVQGQYKRTQISSEGNLFSRGYVSVHENGKRIDLSLPAKWTEEEFPLGEFFGTIWYSKETKIILSFQAN